MNGRAVALPAVLLVGLAVRPARAQEAPQPTSTEVATDSVQNAPAEPPVFAHDLFLLQLVSTFRVAAVDANTRFPGSIGLTEDRLAEHLPGVGFRRNGAPSQAGEYHWFGGDGGALGWMSDRLEWNVEPLGFPYYGAGDPALLPPLGDSLFLLAAPLLSFRPAELVSWRDPTLPDSLEAIALHANGPDGFSHTGGRFRGPIGGGYEFDGRFFRDFSDGRLAAAASDGHSLDFELRRRISHWPARLRFRQVRGERKLAFRWDDTGIRATHRYLLTDVEAATARPDENGEWLFGVGLHHEDQKLESPLLVARRKWFGRTLSAQVSRLGRGTWTRNVTALGTWRLKNDDPALAAEKSLELAIEVHRAFSRVDLVLTGAARSVSDRDPLWRAAVASAWRPVARHRLVAALGRSLELPSLLRRTLPAMGGTGTFSESGNPDLGTTVHESSSLSWSYEGAKLRMSTLAAAGRSRDLAVWQPIGGESSSFTPIPLERRYAGASAVVDAEPWTNLHLGFGINHLFDNSWKGGGVPVYAPEDTWFAEVRWRRSLPGTHIVLYPLASARGARGGSLPDDYRTYTAGLDLRVKQLLIFWRIDNLDDRDYRTGGSAWAYGRHYAYGFRWEFWN